MLTWFSSQFRSSSVLAVTFFSNRTRNPRPKVAFAQETPIQDHITLFLLLLIVKQVRLVPTRVKFLFAIPPSEMQALAKSCFVSSLLP